MILATHSVGGAAVALIFKSNPVLAFIAAFASHFVLDAIPHWDYHLVSFIKNPITKKVRKVARDRRLLIDGMRVGLDASLGLFFAVAAAMPEGQALLPIVLLGVLGGILPDALHLLYRIFENNTMLLKIYQFHSRMHADSKVTDLLPGISAQLMLVALFMLAIQFLV